MLSCTWNYFYVVAPKLKELMRELSAKAADWERIGIELEIDDGDLKQIKSNNPLDNCKCLIEMFRKWLTQVSPEPTWAAIADAVEHIGDKELARRLRSK